MTSSRGGNDTLTAGNGRNNQLYGDAQIHRDETVICGNDRLTSGTGNDAMWGDIKNSLINGLRNNLDLTRVTTGKDVFVFGANNGQDTIHDFRRGEDQIELQGIAGVKKFAALKLSFVNTDTVITFGPDTITVIGIKDLAAEDFIFT